MEIVFITAYRVSQVSMPQHGDGTTYHQEHMMLSKKGHPSPNPRAQLIANMIQFIQSHQSKGWEILLMIDANEAVDNSSQGIASVMCACALYNIMQDTHPEIELLVTYNRGTKTICWKKIRDNQRSIDSALYIYLRQTTIFFSN